MYFTAIRGTSAGKKLWLTQVLYRESTHAVVMCLVARNVEKRKAHSLRKNQTSKPLSTETMRVGKKTQSKQQLGTQ